MHYDIVDGVINHFGGGCVISPGAGLINGRLMTAAQYWLSFRRQHEERSVL